MYFLSSLKCKQINPTRGIILVHQVHENCTGFSPSLCLLIVRGSGGGGAKLRREKPLGYPQCLRFATSPLAPVGAGCALKGLPCSPPHARLPGRVVLVVLFHPLYFPGTVSYGAL